MAIRTRSWRPPESGWTESGRNVNEMERFVSAAAGAALIGWSLQRRDQQAFWAGPLGAMLLYRAATGHCPMYAAAGISTVGETSTRRALSGSGGVHVDESVTINKPIEEVYAYWRRLENLPRIMNHLESVTALDARRSHWAARAPMGTQVEWDAEIINEVPNQVIGWRSLEGSTVVSAGSVNFDALPGGRGTVVRVHLQYDPPGGRLGSWVASAFGEEPSQQIREDLRRFKQLMEAGEISTTEGQPVGRER